MNGRTQYKGMPKKPLLGMLVVPLPWVILLNYLPFWNTSFFLVALHQSVRKKLAIWNFEICRTKGVELCTSGNHLKLKQVKLWFYKLPVAGVEIKAVKLRKNQKSPNILHLQKFRYIPVCTGGKVILLYGTVPLNHLKLILV